jgi:chromosome segregation ATPase
VIRAIKLRNFQAHRSLVIRFSKGITTIKGPTDVGKSAVIRAIRWAVLNDFKGDDFIRWGAEDVLVQLLVDGQVVSRRKGKNGNVYKLGKKVYRAFGNTVPEPIAKLLSMNRDNFQAQLDPHFWIANSASQVSRDLNKVVDLSIIDSSLKNIAHQVREASNRHTVSEERLDQLREQLKSLADQKSRVQDFRRIKEAHEELERLKANGNRIQGLLADASASKPTARIQKAEQGEAIVSAFGAFLRSQARSERLAGLIAEFRGHVGQAEPPNFCPVDAKYQTWLETVWTVSALQNRINLYNATRKAVLKAEAAAEEAEQELHRASKGRCPLCGKNL